MMTHDLSPKRVETAREIAAGHVRYDRPAWMINGLLATGWAGRTLREMRRDGQIVVREDGVVALTDETAEALSHLDAAES